MKNYSPVFTALSASILFLTCFTFSTCKEPDETVQEKRLKLLTGAWHSTNVSVDGVNKNDSFTNYVLTFSPGVYSSVQGDPVWPASGTWTFTDGTASAFTRDDHVVVTITSVTEATLALTLHWNKTTFGTGRISSISGNYVFEFSK